MKIFFKFVKNISILTSIKIGCIYSYIQYKKNSLSKLNIIFDLDETIIHTEKKHNYDNYNKTNISKPDINSLIISSNTYIIWIRPFVKILLPLILSILIYYDHYY